MLSILFLHPLPWLRQQTIDHQVREQNRADSSGLCTYKTCSSFRHRGIFNKFHRQRDVQCSFTAFSSRNRTATHASINAINAIEQSLPIVLKC